MTDGELLRRANDGDVEAFSSIYARYEPIVAAFLVRRCRDPELAADLTAETFAAALLAAGRFEDTGQAAIGWLIGIARNLLLKSWERGRAEERARRRLGMERVSMTDASLERVEALLDANGPLSQALEALPEDQREAIRAHVLEEQSYEEVAARLGVPQATVRQRVSRGLSRLRLAVEGRHA